MLGFGLFLSSGQWPAEVLAKILPPAGRVNGALPQDSTSAGHNRTVFVLRSKRRRSLRRRTLTSAQCDVILLPKGR